MGVRRTRGVPTQRKGDDTGRNNKKGVRRTRGVPTQKNRGRTSSTTPRRTSTWTRSRRRCEYLFMNRKEDIYEMKTLNDLNQVGHVARRRTRHFDRARRPVKFCSSRRPLSRCSWKRSDGRPARWGSVTMGVRKGSHLYYYVLR